MIPNSVLDLALIENCLKTQDNADFWEMSHLLLM